MRILQLEKINTFYGLSHILFDISLDVKEGEIICLLGRNGVGKSTTLKSIIGLIPLRSGSIKFIDQEIAALQTHRIARLGIGYVPEERIIFPDLTVLENLQMGMRSIKINKNWTLEKIYEIFPILKEREKQYGGTLSGGEQQMLTIGRTLMGNPRLILLDEPSEGLGPLVVREVYKQINGLKEKGITILLSEQQTKFALNFSNRIYILEKGRIPWEGCPAMLKDKPEIMKEYLGV